jgi:hypothetical protein
MGMFDSLRIDIDGTPIELQSKLFDQVLESYQLGDVVAGATAGIRVYFETVWLDSKNRMVYVPEKAARSYTVFVVLVHSVFTDYVVVNQELEPTVIESRINELQEFWSDSARLLNRWLEFLAKKQHEAGILRKRLNVAKSAIEYTRSMRAGEKPSKLRLGILNQAEERLERGDDPLDVIDSVLVDNDTEAGWTPPLEHDQLEAYRL